MLLFQPIDGQRIFPEHAVKQICRIQQFQQLLTNGRLKQIGIMDLSQGMICPASAIQGQHCHIQSCILGEEACIVRQTA